MLLNKELLSKIKKIQIKTDRMASEILSGEYKSAFRGRGLNFDTIREYQMGDDIRLIDWNVTAKMSDPFVRQYKEERQLSIVLMLDLSASNDFGAFEKNKKEMIVELAAVLASLAIKNNDKVGMIIFTDHVETYVPPKKGKSHIFKLIRDLVSFKSKSKGTNLQAVLSDSLNLIPRNSVVFMISDFLPSSKLKFEDAFDYERELKVLNKAQDLIAISIRDPREFVLPNIGYVEIINPESGNKELLNLNHKSVRQYFSETQHSYLKSLESKLKQNGVDFLELETNKPYIANLLNFFMRRERRQ